MSLTICAILTASQRRLWNTWGLFGAVVRLGREDTTVIDTVVSKALTMDRFQVSLFVSLTPWGRSRSNHRLRRSMSCFSNFSLYGRFFVCFSCTLANWIAFFYPQWRSLRPALSLFRDSCCLSGAQDSYGIASAITAAHPSQLLPHFRPKPTEVYLSAHQQHVVQVLRCLIALVLFQFCDRVRLSVKRYLEICLRQSVVGHVSGLST